MGLLLFNDTSGWIFADDGVLDDVDIVRASPVIRWDVVRDTDDRADVDTDRDIERTTRGGDRLPVSVSSTNTLRTPDPPPVSVLRKLAFPSLVLLR